MTTKLARDEWGQTSDGEAKRDLYVELRDDMEQAARLGIQDILRARPNDHDVEDVMMHGFNELWLKDRSKVQSVVGMARRICRMRGRDRGDSVLRQRRKTTPLGLDRPEPPAPITEADEASRAAVMEVVYTCKEHLTTDQRSVIEATVEGALGESAIPLKAWVSRSSAKKSYEAWRRQRERGLASLRKCVEATVPEAANVW